jgi:hypothetical protein
MCVAIFFVPDVVSGTNEDGVGRGDESFDVSRNNHNRLPLAWSVSGKVHQPDLSRRANLLPRLMIYSFKRYAATHSSRLLFSSRSSSPHRIAVIPDARRDAVRLLLPHFFAGSMRPGPPRRNGHLWPGGSNNSALRLKAKMSSSPSERVATADRPMPGMTLGRTVLHTHRHTAGGNPN